MKKITLILLILLVGCTKPDLPTPVMPIEKIFTVTESKVTNAQSIHFDLPAKGTYTLTLIDKESGQVVSRDCLLYTSPSPRDRSVSRMPSSA